MLVWGGKSFDSYQTKNNFATGNLIKSLVYPTLLPKIVRIPSTNDFLTEDVVTLIDGYYVCETKDITYNNNINVTQKFYTQPEIVDILFKKECINFIIDLNELFRNDTNLELNFKNMFSGVAMGRTVLIEQYWDIPTKLLDTYMMGISYNFGAFSQLLGDGILSIILFCTFITTPITTLEIKLKVDSSINATWKINYTKK